MTQDPFLIFHLESYANTLTTLACSFNVPTLKGKRVRFFFFGSLKREGCNSTLTCCGLPYGKPRDISEENPANRESMSSADSRDAGDVPPGVSKPTTIIGCIDGGEGAGDLADVFRIRDTLPSLQLGDLL